MSDFDIRKIAGVSFEEIFGNSAEGISYDRVEAFLDRVVQFASEQAQLAPNQLVRVVSNGKICWITQEMAAQFLEKSDTEEVKKDIERALKGDVKFIRQELEILLALAMYTLDQFKKNQSVSAEELEKLEPSLQRRQREINEGISNTTESETLLAEKRKRNPLLEQYEQMMGDFLNSKARGNMTQASDFARQLNNNKKKYLLLTRAIEPDVKTIYYHRLNLQKTKKRILTTQGQLCATRQDTLQMELNQLESKLQNVQDSVDTAEGIALDAAAVEINKYELYDLESAKKELEAKSTELSALEKESSAIKKQEQEVQSVIDHIAENVLQEPDLKADIDNVIKTTQAQAPKIAKPTQRADQPTVSRGSGMHIHRDR